MAIPKIEVKKKPSSSESKRNIAFAIVMLFSVILTATSGIQSTLTRILVQIVAFVGQALLVYTFFSDYYRED